MYRFSTQAHCQMLDLQQQGVQHIEKAEAGRPSQSHRVERAGEERKGERGRRSHAYGVMDIVTMRNVAA